MGCRKGEVPGSGGWGAILPCFGGTGGAGIGGGGEGSVGEAGDDLGDAEARGGLDGVAAAGEVVGDVFGEVWFDDEGIGAPLVVEARGGEGGGGGLVEVEQADEVEEGLGDDGRAAGSAE